MTIHEFWKENGTAVVLIHPSVVRWDYFEYIIPLMKDRYHLVIPALPGYDEERKGDFSSVEKKDFYTGKVPKNAVKWAFLGTFWCLGGV